MTLDPSSLTGIDPGSRSVQGQERAGSRASVALAATDGRASTWPARIVSRVREAWPLLLVASVPLAAVADYAQRSAHAITTNDPAELQVLAQTGGIPHGTSYPLYMALLRLFAYLPIDTFAFRCNLFSGLCAGAALIALSRCVAILDPRCERPPVAGAVAAALLAPSFTMTTVAITTGMYSLHLVLALTAIVLLARWTRRGAPRDVEIALGLLGAMLGNHIMTLALFPAAFVLIVWNVARDRSQIRAVLRGIAWGALGVAVCNVGLFFVQWLNRVPFDHWSLILATPKYFEIDVASANDPLYAWWYETTCRQFRFDIAGATWAQRGEQLGAVLPGIAAELSPAAVLFSAIGLITLFRRSRRIATFIVVTVMTHVILATGYTATIKTNIYLLPVTALFAALSAVGLWATALALHAKLFRRIGDAPRKAVALGVAAIGLFVFAHLATRSWLERDAIAATESARRRAIVSRAIRSDERNERATYDLAQRVADALPPNTLLFADWSRIFAIHYVLRIERGITSTSIFEPLPYGGNPTAFPIDFVERIEARDRTSPVFFVNPAAPPPIPGFHLVLRTPELSELVRDDD